MSSEKQENFKYECADRYLMKKHDLVLIHSFPTNSTILRGLTDFLKDYFNVHFIDLPGFNKDVPPLKDISMENYASYVQDYIENLGLNKYWIGGISFGFLIANSVVTGKKCRGILSIEPYLESQQLGMKWYVKLYSVVMAEIIHYIHINKIVYGSRLFKSVLKLTGAHPRHTKMMLKTVDARTFFETARLILKDSWQIRFKKVPYILIINKNDRTINPQYARNKFKKNVEDLIIVHTTVEHYPKYIKKVYFQKHIKKKDMKRIISYMDKHDKKQRTAHCKHRQI